MHNIAQQLSITGSSGPKALNDESFEGKGKVFKMGILGNSGILNASPRMLQGSFQAAVRALQGAL